ncbi:MAG: DUF1579 domain-containing protein [Balneolales bacterium]|nr:DUF1579 domain-containing protein [Balneolales bacterium]
MKSILLYILLFSGISAFAQTTPDALFKKLQGEWDIEVEITPAPGYDSIKETGTAAFNSLFNSSKLSGDFAMPGAEGVVFISYSEIHGRYEYYQIDNVSRSSLLLYGDYDPESDRLNFSGIPGLAQWGFNPELNMRLEFQFNEDGTILEELYLLLPNGEYFLQSSYMYSRK